MRILNLGILAHVDAGKTSLTERLLYAAGVIDQIGSVDDGNTQTDSLALERQRGITIKSAVVSFAIDDVTVNLIDTPGHPDFIAEVERVLSVLDGAVLVVSAVEGVQAQTRILMRTLQRLRIPTLLFVNKIDRSGATAEGTLDAIAGKLTPAVVAMGAASGLGTREPGFRPFGAGDEAFTTRLTELIADHDDAFLAAYVNDATPPPYDKLRRALADQTRQANVHPVFFGSAITGSGVPELTAAIKELLPAEQRDAGGDVDGTVFKVERGPNGEKIAYARMFTGSIHARDRIAFGRGRSAKVTGVKVFDNGDVVQRGEVRAGEIAKLWGLADIQIGDRIGERSGSDEHHYFAPPTLETVVIPENPRERGPLRVALAQLAEQDPLINLRQDDVRQELFVSLYGEVQKEVIQHQLAEEFGLAVSFRESTTICVERPNGPGSAVEFMGSGQGTSTHQRIAPTLEGDPNPFLATVGLRIEPAPVGSGVRFKLDVSVHGTMPPAFYKAVEDTVYDTLHQGLRGWEVTDCLVVLTHTGYAPRQSHSHQGFDKSMSSTGADFRGLTPLVVMSALREAGTTVYEPIHHFRLEVPADVLGPLLPALAKLQVVPYAPETRGTVCVLEGDLPAANVYELQQQLPGLTRGEGVLEYAFDHYQPVRGSSPERPRTDNNPLDRKEYLLRVQRRVTGLGEPA
ncbi:GTP-binding protein [Flindersiella endophytica]